MNKGLTHIYNGNGKGKTSAAIGLCIRFIGTGRKAIFAQFLKGQESSERAVLSSLGVKVVNPEQPTKFVRDMDEGELSFCQKAQKNCLAEISVLIKSGEYRLLILDEILDAIELNLIDEKDIIDLINTSENLEIVLTGRNAAEQLVALADYISEIKAIRHPYEKGILARKGIEY